MTEKDDRPWLDRLLKESMPNFTVIRRYVMFSYLFKAFTVGLVVQLVGDANENTNTIEEAICAVVLYTEQQADNTSLPVGHELRKLGRDMRDTGVDCPG